jgi:CheY-like chemotaxis protein
MNILLIEDSSFLRATIARALVRAGHAVVGVGDGRKALPAATTSLPEVILLDMMLPGLDGLGVMKELQDHPATAKIPIIVLSGLAQANESRLKKSGAAAYIEKESLDLEGDARVLLSAIDRVCGKDVQAAPTVELGLPAAAEDVDRRRV